MGDPPLVVVSSAAFDRYAQAANLMSEELARLLDLGTAWTRVKQDVNQRIFIRNPYALPVIELDLEGWLGRRLRAIQDDVYAPRPMFVCDIPKGRGLIRPGSHLSHEDRLIYTACVGACFRAIHERLRWSQNEVDFSYRLAVDPESPDWLRDRFTGWKNFQDRSMRAINDRVSHVVVADISSFYDNIDISMLVSDLRGVGAPEPAIAQLSGCLNRWAQVQGRGIPQGQSASDILAKLYFDNIDRNLRNMGYPHMRYVDDIRIFCRSYVQAKRLLIDLSTLLRRRGLSLQSAKSKICDAENARERIDEITATLRGLNQEFIREVAQQTGIGDPYMHVHQADEILEQNPENLPDPENAPLEVIKAAYQRHVIEEQEALNGTLFRFLVNRLAKQRDSFAVEHCLGLLEPYPEETSNILHYLTSVGPGQDVEGQIVELMRVGTLVYEYQYYELVEWFYDRETEPSVELLEFARARAFDAGLPRYLRTMCRALVGKFGDAADLERIANLYDGTNDPSERAEIICSIGRMERARRNAFLARVQADGEYSQLAVRWVRAQHHR